MIDPDGFNPNSIRSLRLTATRSNRNRRHDVRGPGYRYRRPMGIALGMKNSPAARGRIVSETSAVCERLR